MLRRFFRSKNRLELFSIAMILLLIMVLMMQVNKNHSDFKPITRH